MTTTVKEQMYQAIEKHGNNLNAIFSTGIEPILLCKKLFRLENKAHRLTTDECNTGADHGEELERIRQSVIKILHATDKQADAIFINGDARGYALKIRDKFVMDNSLNIYSDWGGYGIIAPDFIPNN